MKFLTDEHVDIAVVGSLREAGVDIVSIQDIDMRGRNDKEILSYAKNKNRVVVTGDEDFLRLHAKGVGHAGILFLTKPLTVGAIKRDVEKLTLMFETLENIVIFLPLK